MDPIIPARRGIPEGLKTRLCGRSGNSHFASSEKCQLACAFCFCHGGVKVRPKAIKVNRPWLVGIRAIRQPGLDTFCDRFDVTDFHVISFYAWPFGARAEEPAANAPMTRAVWKVLPGIKSCTH